MKKAFVLIGSTVVGSIGWWVGDRIAGTMTAFILMMVGTGLGMYAGARYADRVLD